MAELTALPISNNRKKRSLIKILHKNIEFTFAENNSFEKSMNETYPVSKQLNKAGTDRIKSNHDASVLYQGIDKDQAGPKQKR